MKKILTIILICFSFIKNIYAETIYGEYYKVDGSNLTESDEIKIDKYKVYNTYDIERIDIGYLEENKEYIKDENDFIIKEELTPTYNNEDEYINIYTSEVNRKYIILTNLTEMYKLYEIEIFYDDEKLDYLINNYKEFEKNKQEDINNIKDNNFDTYYEYRCKYIELNINEVKSINKLKIIIYTDDSIESNINFKMQETNDIKLNKNKKHIITFNNNQIEERVEYLYNTNIKLYKYYKENIIKLNNYIKEGNNLLLNDYKEITDYYKRDKLILNDNLIINNKEQTINDLIEYKSNEIKTECDINYQINGVYECRFILNNIDIKRNIIVNIKDNNTEEINKNNIIEIEETEAIKYETKDIIELEEKEDIFVPNEEIKETKKLNNKTNLEEKNEETEENKIKLKNLTKKKTVKKKINSKKEKDLTKNKKCNIKSKITFILVINFLILILLRKRKRDNVERV